MGGETERSACGGGQPRRQLVRRRCLDEFEREFLRGLIVGQVIVAGRDRLHAVPRGDVFKRQPLEEIVMDVTDRPGRMVYGPGLSFCLVQETHCSSPSQSSGFSPAVCLGSNIGRPRSVPRGRRSARGLACKLLGQGGGAARPCLPLVPLLTECPSLQPACLTAS